VSGERGHTGDVAPDDQSLDRFGALVILLAQPPHPEAIELHRGDVTEHLYQFFGEDDTALYRDLLASQCRKHGVAVFAIV